ncbi:putative short-chain dehydrogenase [Hypomontagnella submonticulosa]|nr:putative short-chain dehydrogenase [Hypomontagnella submonticulosa]
MPADTLSLDGKVAIVTGSGRENGIGAAIAKTFARNGAAVAIHYTSSSSAPRARALAQSIRDEFGVGVAVIEANLATPEGCQAVVTETMEQLKVDQVDILVNNAGIGLVKTLWDHTLPEIQESFAVNVYATILTTKAAVDIGKMPHGGRVINISSIAHKTYPPLLPIYAASKAAQDTITVMLAGEIGRSHGITVNSIGPGPIITDINKDSPEVFNPLLLLQRGTDRIGMPQDIADIALFIASEKSRWLTAKYIAADAGITGM